MDLKIDSLPKNLLKDNAIKLELEQGVIIFRASEKIQDRIAELLEKEKTSTLTSEETEEFNAYEEIDDYLSHINRLIRNSSDWSASVPLATVARAAENV